MTFTEKVLAMTAKEIIMAMVEGLKKPYTKIAMGSFGYRNNIDCFGCAATNTICYIDGTVNNLLPPGVEGFRIYFEYIVNDFESAIDALRQGDITEYNIWVSRTGIAKIRKVDYISLPRLGDDYTHADLEPYIALANAQ